MFTKNSRVKDLMYFTQSKSSVIRKHRAHGMFRIITFKNIHTLLRYFAELLNVSLATSPRNRQHSISFKIATSTLWVLAPTYGFVPQKTPLRKLNTTLLYKVYVYGLPINTQQTHTVSIHYLHAYRSSRLVSWELIFPNFNRDSCSKTQK